MLQNDWEWANHKAGKPFPEELYDEEAHDLYLQGVRDALDSLRNETL